MTHILPRKQCPIITTITGNVQLQVKGKLKENLLQDASIPWLVRWVAWADKSIWKAMLVAKLQSWMWIACPTPRTGNLEESKGGWNSKELWPSFRLPRSKPRSWLTTSSVTLATKGTMTATTSPPPVFSALVPVSGLTKDPDYSIMGCVAFPKTLTTSIKKGKLVRKMGTTSLKITHTHTLYFLIFESGFHFKSSCQYLVEGIPWQ